MRALTAARLLLHPDRYPWFTSLCCRTFRLHPLNIAPVAAMLCYRPRLGPRFALAAIGGASDFVQSQQSQQSYSAVSSSDRESPLDSSVYGLSLHFQLLSTSPRGDAVTFSYWRLAPPERDFHPLALAAPKCTGSDRRCDPRLDWSSDPMPVSSVPLRQAYPAREPGASTTRRKFVSPWA